MKLPPEIEFHPDIRLLIYRPRGLINEAAINRVISVIEGIEAESQKPFNRFSDATGDPRELSSTSDTLFKFLFIGASPTRVVRL